MQQSQETNANGPDLESAAIEDTVDRLVRAEQVEVIYRQALPAMVISVITAALLCATLWDVVDRIRIVAWFAAIVLIAVLRAALVFLYGKEAPSGFDVLAWERPFLVSLLLSASVWGVGGLLLFPHESMLHQAVLYFFLMGMTGGSAALYSAHFFGVAFTIVVILMPATIALFSERALIPSAVAIGGCIYVLSTLRSAKLFAFFRRRSVQLAHELKLAHATAERAARTDELTDLRNRRAFVEDAHVVLREARRYGHPLSVVVLDIDFFKRINDTKGHAAGDAALRHLATILRENTREADLCGRLGGEEFAVLLPSTAADEAILVAEKLRRVLEESTVLFGSERFTVTASFGVADGALALEELLHRADVALYRAKAEGRNQVIPYGEEAATK